LRSRSHSSAFTSGCSTTSRAGVKTALLPDKARTWRDPMRAQWRKEGAMCRQTRLLKIASLYRSGERGWVKVKNPTYWRRDAEREAVAQSRERRMRTRA
jgi:hypothetical protein